MWIPGTSPYGMLPVRHAVTRYSATILPTHTERKIALSEAWKVSFDVTRWPLCVAPLRLGLCVMDNDASQRRE